ncbi:MAG: hypothetical protein KDA58_17095, partial [Planctomycetaceae bacterium]|nr:hypothetical protein [Planctomycetaceae bacterium]
MLIRLVIGAIAVMLAGHLATEGSAGDLSPAAQRDLKLLQGRWQVDGQTDVDFAAFNARQVHSAVEGFLRTDGSEVVFK